MAERRFRHEEHGIDIGAERALELAGRDAQQTILRMLFGGIVDQDIKPAEHAYCFADDATAEHLVAEVSPDGEASAVAKPRPRGGWRIGLRRGLRRVSWPG